MRQEASRLGGIGSCGRELCCSTWLTDFKTVSTSAARYQNLSLNTLKLAGQCGKLKCCLNYELDSYMDALRDIPNDVDRIETLNGVGYLQKTDIFKKMMWFSYPGAESWIPLSIAKVKEIAEMNKAGKKPETLDFVPQQQEVKKPVILDYENVVGQDSLTRLDDKNKKRRKKKSKTKVGSSTNAKPTSAAPTEAKVVKEVKQQTPQAPKEQKANVEAKTTDYAAPKTEQKKKRRFNNNRNKPRNNDNKTNKGGE